LQSSAQWQHLIAVLRTAVPRLTTSCTVPPNMNKLAVVGQTPFGCPGADPQQTPTPLEGQAKPGPLQVYETDRPFFGSTPVGGLDIMTSKQLIKPWHHLSSSSSPPIIINIRAVHITFHQCLQFLKSRYYC